MDYFGAKGYLSREQAQHMANVKQKLDAIKRLANAAHDPFPIRSGLQMGFIMFDVRTGYWRESFGLLFDVGKENRYRWMLNMQKQNGLIGWHDATRQEAAAINRPILQV